MNHENEYCTLLWLWVKSWRESEEKMKKTKREVSEKEWTNGKEHEEWDLLIDYSY